jgi:hypothetical protein
VSSKAWKADFWLVVLSVVKALQAVKFFQSPMPYFLHERLTPG